MNKKVEMLELIQKEQQKIIEAHSTMIKSLMDIVKHQQAVIEMNVKQIDTNNTALKFNSEKILEILEKETI